MVIARPIRGVAANIIQSLKCNGRSLTVWDLRHCREMLGVIAQYCGSE
jgi:hypothetical protein